VGITRVSSPNLPAGGFFGIFYTVLDQVLCK
jgi:hypothetical protein